MQYVQKMMAETGGSFMSVLAKEGVDLNGALSWLSDDDVINIKGQEQTIGELKSQLGLNDQEVIGAIQLLYKNFGESQVSIRDSANGTYQALNVLNASAQARADEDMKRFTAMLNSMGIDASGLNPANIGALYGELKSIESQDWASQEDKAEAIKNAFSTFDKDLANTLETYTTHKILGMSKKLVETTPEISSTIEEVKANAKDAYAKYGKGLDSTFAKITEGKSQEAIEEIAKLLPEAEKAQEKSKEIFLNNKALERIRENQKGFDNALKSEFVTKLQEGVDSGKLKDGDATRMAIDSALKDMGIASETYRQQIIDRFLTDGVSLKQAITEASANYDAEKAESIEKTRTASTEYVNTLGLLYSKGIITLDEAKAGLGSVNFNEIDTSTLGTEGQNLYNEVKSGVDDSSGRLKQAELVVDKDYANAGDIEALASNVKGLWDKMVSIAQSMWDSITGAFQGSATSNPLPVFSPSSFGGLVGGALCRSSGGPVDGRYTGFSKGTDSVPAMLTPGEYVLRRKAVESLGQGFLSNLNQHGVQALQKLGGNTIINNVYNTNNAKVSQNIDNKSQYLNGMYGLDRLMRYV